MVAAPGTSVVIWTRPWGFGFGFFPFFPLLILFWIVVARGLFWRGAWRGRGLPIRRTGRRAHNGDAKCGPTDDVKHILVVDDEPRIAEIARDYLERAGYRVTVAGNGVDALAIARTRQPDLIVLDLGLPQGCRRTKSRAFDRFNKGPASRGSGLGLTIARGLVTAHGGEIRASSAPGAGTTMSFTLPRDGAS